MNQPCLPSLYAVVLPSTPATARPTAQRGISLVVVLFVLIITSLLGVGATQIAMMSERAARSDRDQQIALQAAEAALADAELDIFNTRRSLFSPPNPSLFEAGCGTGASMGLCNGLAGTKPAWLTRRRPTPNPCTRCLTMGHLHPIPPLRSAPSADEGAWQQAIRTPAPATSPRRRSRLADPAPMTTEARARVGTWTSPTLPSARCLTQWLWEIG
jgi:type II secretory pathway pseudopilin PulG